MLSRCMAMHGYVDGAIGLWAAASDKQKHLLKGLSEQIPLIRMAINGSTATRQWNGYRKRRRCAIDDGWKQHG